MLDKNTLKIQVANQIMLRVPQLPASASLENHFEALKYSIRFASPELYKQIKDTPTNMLPLIKETQRYAIEKYFNRAKFRSTPFGNFASVSPISLSDTGYEDKIQIEQTARVQQFQSWSRHSIENSSEKKRISDQEHLVVNSSYYLSGTKLRYLSFSGNQYQISEIEHDPLILKIMKYCEQPQTLKELSAILPTEENDKNKTMYIKHLIRSQLLIDQSAISLIGHDQLIANSSQTSSEENYLISHRQVRSGSVDRKLFAHLPTLIEQLHAGTEHRKSPALLSFTSAFIRKYGEREIPIMEALDPEIGIGYQDLEQNPDHSALLKQLKTETSKRGDRLSTFPLSLTTSNCKGYLELEDIPFNRFPPLRPLPNTFSAVVSVAGDEVWLSSIGGVTANALLGRFSLENEEWTQICRNNAALESRANPKVTFFDICYQGEGKVDNINRRASIYPYQLHILSQNSSEKSLQISDLFLSVKDGQIHLRSKETNKRLVPRLASAYNYIRSDLGLFRFLCDLQGQGLQTYLNLNLWQQWPDLRSYPRIQYRNIIISPAKWRINYHDVIKTNKIVDITHLKAHLASLGCSRNIQFGYSDQKLRIDTDQPEELSILLKYLKKNPECYLEEAPLIPNFLVHNVQEQAYHSQLILTLQHMREIYQKIPAKRFEKQAAPINFPPGSRWVYFEIFCHELYTNLLLTETLSPLFKSAHALWKNWFFIRYTENGNHLRLRFELSHPKKGYLITSMLADLLKYDLASGRVSDLLIRSYWPEVERYGVIEMQQVERHFCRDSDFVLHLLSSRSTDHQKYRLAESTVMSLLNTDLFTKPLFEDLVKRIAESYLREHQTDLQNIKSLNKTYKEYARSIGEDIEFLDEGQLSGLSNSLAVTLRHYDSRTRPEIFADLMHMHFNRMFSSDQRIHEMIFYYFLCRTLRLKPKIAESPTGFI